MSESFHFLPTSKKNWKAGIDSALKRGLGSICGKRKKRKERASAMSNPFSSLTRRHFLWQSASGLGGVALAWLLNRDGRAHAAPHAIPKVRRVVQVFCPGGVSHVDTFDYKPDLEKHNGEELSGKGKIDTFFSKPGRLMKNQF